MIQDRRTFLHYLLLVVPLARPGLLAAISEPGGALTPPKTNRETNPMNANTPNPIVVINPFEVPAERQEVALRHWDRVAAFMEKQDGFISAKLHQSVDPQARFRFVTVAEWKSPAQFMAVLASDELKQLAQGLEEFPHYPGAYQVIRGG